MSDWTNFTQTDLGWLGNLERRIMERLHERFIDRLLAKFGGVQRCPWCKQCAQSYEGTHYSDKADAMVDALHCGNCGGVSRCRFEMGMMSLEPIGQTPPPVAILPPSYSDASRILWEQFREAYPNLRAWHDMATKAQGETVGYQYAIIEGEEGEKRRWIHTMFGSQRAASRAGGKRPHVTRAVYAGAEEKRQRPMSAAGWDHRYRRLDYGEEIKERDEIEDARGRWYPVRAAIVGMAAPDPSYSSHRTYRRLKGT